MGVKYFNMVRNNSVAQRMNGNARGTHLVDGFNDSYVKQFQITEKSVEII